MSPVRNAGENGGGDSMYCFTLERELIRREQVEGVYGELADRPSKDIGEQILPIGMRIGRRFQGVANTVVNLIKRGECADPQLIEMLDLGYGDEVEELVVNASEGVTHALPPG